MLLILTFAKTRIKHSANNFFNLACDLQISSNVAGHCEKEVPLEVSYICIISDIAYIYFYIFFIFPIFF